MTENNNGAQWGFNSKLRKVKEDSDDHKFAKITSIGLPEQDADEVDLTSFDSEDGFREFVQGLKDPGSVDIEALYTKDFVDEMQDDFNDGTISTYVIEFPNEEGVEFKAFVQSIGGEVPMEEGISMSVSLKLTGKPEWKDDATEDTTE